MLGQWPSEKYPLSFNQQKVSVIIDSIAQVYHVNFSYNAQLPQLNRTVSLNQECTLYEALNALFGATETGFDIIGRQVIIFPLISKKTNESVFIFPDSMAFVKGKVKDYHGNSLSYASVAVAHTSIATVANQNGDFLLKYPVTSQKDTLVISYIGYQSVSIALDTLRQKTFDIVLRELPYQIKPVIVKNVDAQYIVRQAIDAIYKNYCQKNIMYSAFYREIIRDEENYLSIVEALVDIAKAPYSSGFLNDQARIFKGHKSQATKSLQAFSFKLEGGVYNCINLDIVKENPVFFNSNGMNSYSFSLEEKIPYNGRILYVIRFKPIRAIDDLSYEGILYIDQETYAIAGASFSLTREGVEYARHLLIKKSSRKIQIKPTEANYKIFYRLINNKWYFDYSSIELKLKARSSSFLYNNIITTRSELIATYIDTSNNGRFRTSEIVKSADVIADIIDKYDDNYWGSFNVILPEEPIIEAIEKLNINKNLKANESFWKAFFYKKQ
jgi:hypothetical protein